MEQVFVTVKDWSDDKISGLLASKVALPDHKEGEPLTVAEADVLDWTIVRADGSEEGNLIGKYLDSVQKTPPEKAEALKLEAPKIEPSKADIPKVEIPKDDTPKIEEAKPAAPVEKPSP